MELPNILQLLGQILFWIVSVVVVGVCINWLSDYLKPYRQKFFGALKTRITAFISARSARVRDRIERNREVLESRVKYLQEHPERVIELRTFMLYLQLKGAILYICGYVTMLAAVLMFLLVRINNLPLWICLVLTLPAGWFLSVWYSNNAQVERLADILGAYIKSLLLTPINDIDVWHKK